MAANDRRVRVGVELTVEQAREFQRDLEDAGAASEDMGESVDEAGEASKRTSRRFGGLRDAARHVERGLLAASATILAAGGSLVALDERFAGAERSIRVGTGAIGEDLELLNDIARGIAREVPQSIGEVSTVVAELDTLTDATDDTLRGLSRTVLDASRLMEEDASGAAEQFGQMLAQWQRPASEGEATLDRLFAISQQYGVGLTEQIGALNEYGAVLANAGFTLEEVAALMGRMNAAGLEWSRISPGLNMAFRSWAEEGKDLRSELTATVDEIQRASSESEALNLAAEEFGAEGAQRLVRAIRSGRFSLEDLGSASLGTRGRIRELSDDTMLFSERMSIAWGQIQESLEPVAERVADFVDEHADSLIDLLDHLDRLVEHWDSLDESTQTWILRLGGLLLIAGPTIRVLRWLLGPLRLIGGAVVFIVSNFRKLLDILGNLPGRITRVLGPLAAFASTMWQLAESTLIISGEGGEHLREIDRAFAEERFGFERGELGGREPGDAFRDREAVEDRFGVDLDELGGRQLGGSLTRGRTFRVGEAGPELVRLAAGGATVTPAHAAETDTATIPRPRQVQVPVTFEGMVVADSRDQLADQVAKAVRRALRDAGEL